MPRAGEGPSEELREKGYHTYYAIGTCTGSNTRHVATFKASPVLKQVVNDSLADLDDDA